MFVVILGCFYLFFWKPTDTLCQETFDIYLSKMNTILTQQNSSNNHTKFECVWKPINSQCPDSDINFYYYSGFNASAKKKINLDKINPLTEIHWNPQKENIIFIHGYDGADGRFPSNILRDAYIKNGSYNVFIVDWSPLARIPCYTAAVSNLNTVAKCTALLYRNLHFQGIPSYQITCVGHSLGAHGCGLVSSHVNFRMHRIIGLDPAGPMIPSSSRLKSGMANLVQVIHTNAGTFGDSTSSGRVNFCVNGGKFQPPCNNSALGPDLCSHIIAICYMAESIDGSTARKAHTCTRQCPYGPRLSSQIGYGVFIGQHTPEKVYGSYCIDTNEPPYCSNGNNRNGHPWCCLNKRNIKKKRIWKIFNQIQA